MKKRLHFRFWIHNHKGLAAYLMVFLCLFIAGTAYAGVTIYQILNPKTLFDVSDPTPSFGEPTPSIASSPSQPPALSPSPASSPPPSIEPSAPPEITVIPYPSDGPVNWEVYAETSRLNILVLGLDGSPERGEGYNSDTIIIVSIDLDKKDVALLSVPRDCYVPIYPDGTFDKINSAYGMGGGMQKSGFEYVIKSLQALTGVKIHHYIGFNMPVVKNVVNTMGGIDYNVELEIKMGGRILSPGQQKLDGQQVLDYCRFRGTPQADIGRIDRQQKMLKAIFSQLLSTGQIANIPNIFNAIVNDLFTDLDYKKVVSLALFGTSIQLSDISTYTIPGQGINLTNYGYFAIHNDQYQKMLFDIFHVNVILDQKLDYEYVYNLMDTCLKQISDQEQAIQITLNTAKSLIEQPNEKMTADDTKNLKKAVKEFQYYMSVMAPDKQVQWYNELVQLVKEFS